MKSSANFSLQNQAEHSFQIINSESLKLPVLATASDVREVVQFLKRYADGITIVQAMDAFRKRVLDPRKIAAYEFWGIISRNGDRLKLTSLGWHLASRLEPEAEVYRAVLNRTDAYHAALKWIYEQSLELVTDFEVGVFWQKQHAEAIEGDSEEELEASAASFFHLCHAAEVGLLTVGRKSQPTRLHILREELGACLSSDPLIYSEARSAERLRSTSTERVTAQSIPARLQRVFISHGQTLNSIRRIIEALELAGFEYEVVKRNQTQAIVDFEQTLEVMRRCDAGIITVDQLDYGDVAVRGDMQLGAALMHFDQRLVFLLKKGLSLPASLSQISSCEFDEDLTWDVAVQVVRSIKHLQAPT